MIEEEKLIYWISVIVAGIVELVLFALTIGPMLPSTGSLAIIITAIVVATYLGGGTFTIFIEQIYYDNGRKFNRIQLVLMGFIGAPVGLILFFGASFSALVRWLFGKPYC